MKNKMNKNINETFTEEWAIQTIAKGDALIEKLQNTDLEYWWENNLKKEIQLIPTLINIDQLTADLYKEDMWDWFYVAENSVSKRFDQPYPAQTYPQHFLNRITKKFKFLSCIVVDNFILITHMIENRGVSIRWKVDYKYESHEYNSYVFSLKLKCKEILKDFKGEEKIEYYSQEYKKRLNHSEKLAERRKNIFEKLKNVKNITLSKKKKTSFKHTVIKTKQKHEFV